MIHPVLNNITSEVCKTLAGYRINVGKWAKAGYIGHWLVKLLKDQK